MHVHVVAHEKEKCVWRTKGKGAPRTGVLVAMCADAPRDECTEEKKGGEARLFERKKTEPKHSRHALSPTSTQTTPKRKRGNEVSNEEMEGHPL